MLEQNATPRALTELSERERAVAEKFATGLTYREIGKALFIAPSTVRTHLTSIYQKLGVHSKIDLARRFPGRLPEEKHSPVLAVLPFKSHSDDAQWTRLANGLSVDITIDLARLSGLSVIASHTMSALVGRADAVSAARELNADYILEGQLRVEGPRIRFAVQLSDGQSGASLWSERFDRPGEDIFVVQDELATCVVNVLAGGEGKLAKLGRRASRHKAPVNLTAYDCYQLGLERHHDFSREANADAIRLLSRAVELDPEFARAWMKLAYAYAIEACNGFGSNVHQSIRKWEEAAAKSLLLDPFDSVAYMCMGDARAAMGDLNAAAGAYERAFELGPNYADTLALLGGSRVLVMGDPQQGYDLIDRALKLNPWAPPWYLGMKGRADFVLGRYDESIIALRQSPAESPATLLFLAMAHAERGDTQAAAAARRLRTEFPDFSVEGFMIGYPVKNPPAVAAIHRAAGKAGLA